LLSSQFFKKHIQLSEEAKAQRTRKGGSNTWEERKAQWTEKFPTLAKEVTTNTDLLKKVESSKPMIFEGSFAGKAQTFLVDSGCTTMVVGRSPDN
jgi:hypothetical protein